MKTHLTRRGALRAIAGLGLGAAAAAACGDGDDDSAAPPISCVLTPEQIEGPYFLDTGLLRRDITEDRPGVPLRIELRLASLAGGGCAPLSGAVVEVWHADAAGVYSGYDRRDGNLRDAAGETFLRGYQVSDDRGSVEFETVYPGWYPGRTIHVHLLVRVDAQRASTTQLYFPESVNDAVSSREPYVQRGTRSTTNASDLVAGPALADLISEVTREGDGYLARYSLGIAG